MMAVYGGRFRKDKKEDLKKELENYGIKNEGENESLPKDFPICFKNESLIQAVNMILLALKNKRNVIILGNPESGLTYVAELCSRYFNFLKKHEDKSFICFCTKNLECSDLLGTHKLVNDTEKKSGLLKFEPRFLYEAIKNGNCVVLDSINEASSKVIERLNGLLDKKILKEEKKFEVPEDSSESKIEIHKNFRIICTSNFQNIEQISPAFVNRFEVVVLENQLGGSSYNKDEIEKLIEILCNRHQKEYYNNFKNNKRKIEKNKNPLLNTGPNNNQSLEEKIEVTGEIKSLILKKLEKFDDYNEASSKTSYNELNENPKHYLTMSSINKFCRAFIFFKNKFRGQKIINLSTIIDFTFDLLFENQLLNLKDINNNYKIIQDELLQELIKSDDYKNINNKDEDLGEEEYYFKDSESLENFMIQIYACSLVNQHLCIVGPPGIGKTIGARKFSILRQKILGIEKKPPFYMQAFHQFTRPSDYFGNFSLDNEQLVFKEGTLTKSIKQGKVFIGDEFNISSEDCMKAITPSLELKFGENILIPGIENEISINPNFYFIICQNDTSTFGRNELPDKIKAKLKIIKYPDRIEKEIVNICEKIYAKLIEDDKEKKIGNILTSDKAKICGKFLMELNKKGILTPWSLRDISKLFARIKKQSKKPPDHYENLGLYEHILFYILSSTNEFSRKERGEMVVELIDKTFNIDKEEKIKLKELYNKEPHLKIKGDNKDKLYIEQGGGHVSLFYCKNGINIFEQLTKLKGILRALFEILIASDDEPILISGPSSFKTFLAELLFKNRNEKYDVISLNSELTISQLIGSPTILSLENEKYYYLNQIYEILQANNIELLLQDLKDFQGNKEKIKKTIEDLKVELIRKKRINKIEEYPFNYALEKFQEKLFKDEKSKKNSLFNIKLEFKPGIFISSLIKGVNLILKNITNVKTENLERLNEAFTGNKKITLNEDTQDSFTDKNTKEIKFNNFRIIATCNEGDETSLSEAFLSRFTLIYVDKYSEDEEENVLKKLAESNNIDDEDIEENDKKVSGEINLEELQTKLNEFYDFCKNKSLDFVKINLAQKINCIEITKELNKKMKNNSPEQNLYLALYNLLKGTTEKRSEYLNDLNNTFNIKENNKDSIKEYDNNFDISPLELQDNYKVKSKISNITININRMEKIEEKEKEKLTLVFTTKIKEILDTIHFAIFTGTPLILEGSFGQGKKSAIEYYAKMMKLDLDFVPISKSTKVDDLLSKTIFKENEKGIITLENSITPLTQAIKYEGNFPNKLVVLEGINNASPAVLEVLNSIYGKKGTKILLPNGSTIVKRNVNLISILNPTDNFTKEKLPRNLINNSIYLTVEDPDEKDINYIIYKLFKEANLEGEQDIFAMYFKHAQEIARNADGEFPFTLYEVRKYISLRKSINTLDKKIFLYFIFNNHFSRRENIKKIHEIIKFETISFNPSIEYYDKNQFLIFKMSEKGKRNNLTIKIKNPEKIKPKELKEKFNSITSYEKLCILFLLCCVKAKMTPIIQGITASGKSFIIKLFSEILGEDLTIYQLNSNSGISIFTGQSILKKEFDNKEKQKIKDIL